MHKLLIVKVTLQIFTFFVACPSLSETARYVLKIGRSTARFLTLGEVDVQIDASTGC